MSVWENKRNSFPPELMVFQDFDKGLSPGMDPSCEAGLKHNQKVVGCSCNSHATIAHLACQVSNITYRIHSCIRWLMTILFQSRLNGTFPHYKS